MKKFFNSISTKISAMATRAKTAVAAVAASAWMQRQDSKAASAKPDIPA